MHSLVDTRVFSEGEFGEVRDAAGRFLGSGPTRTRELEGERLALMPYVTLAAFFPLAFILWRRNILSPNRLAGSIGWCNAVAFAAGSPFQPSEAAFVLAED